MIGDGAVINARGAGATTVAQAVTAAAMAVRASVFLNMSCVLDDPIFARREMMTVADTAPTESEADCCR